ncbi:hypothetical protein JCM10213_006333 [Rhodosporidiobolus nylandii]
MSAKCYVCGQDASQRCSGCEKEPKIPFCSAKCQKIAYPVHKWQCRTSVGTFVFPPLTDDDAELFRARDPAVVGRPVRDAKVGFMKQLADLKLWAGTKEDLLTALQQSPSACTIPEPLRSCLILWVNSCIISTDPTELPKEGVYPPPPYKPTPFQSGISSYVEWWKETLRKQGKTACDPPTFLYERSSTVLTHLVMLQTLMRQRVYMQYPDGRCLAVPSAEVPDKMLKTVYARVLDEIHAVEVTGQQQDVLRFWVSAGFGPQVTCLP